jgi:hypothetical protein
MRMIVLSFELLVNIFNLVIFLRLGFAFFTRDSMSSDLKTLIKVHLYAELNCKREAIASA